MIRRDELPAYAAELGVTAIFAAILHRLDRQYEPNWTWVTVMIGVIISAGPPIILARQDQATHWRDYERRSVAGFCASGLIIIGWQLWQYAERRGRRRGYVLARRITEANHNADTPPPVEPET